MKKIHNISNFGSRLTVGIFFSLGILSASTAIANEAVPKHAPKDPGVINEERIEYWLKKRGELKQSATKEEIEIALSKYRKRASSHAIHGKFTTPVIPASLQKGSKQGLKNIEKGVPKTVKALGILVDFPDLPFDNNQLAPGDTGMYYSSYPVDHYRQLMFSTSGYQGPSSQNLMSGYQYYQQESGQEFFFTGDVFGWVTADSNAKVYGGHDPDDDDDKDQDPGTLIQEAITKAVADNNIDLTEYDVEDPFDLDQDGNVNEADGFVDHVNVFHSSIGEEAGGGVLGDDAIWSHRFFVNPTGNPSTMGFAIPGTTKKLFGYTIQPIDAATGVVVHEFGHDLGLADEYDTGASNDGAPTGNWSVMAGGSWTGSPSGSKPVGFSPLAKEFLQARHGANWVDQKVIDFSSLSGTTQSENLVEAVNHSSGTNQLKITIPNPLVDFDAAYSGDYQYYSDFGHDLRTELTFDLVIPAATSVSLEMKARWNTEQDWDYAQMSVNGVAVKGNYTVDASPLAAQYANYANVTHFISGKSLDAAGAEGALGWLDLTYDLSSFQGQTVSIKFFYYTDSNTGDYGFVFDDLQLIADSVNVYSDGAETAGVVILNGFQRITDKRDGKPQNYWVQLRSHNGVDDGLLTRGYDPGVVIWFADASYSDNKMDDHAGHGFIGVVDADQTLIGTSSSSVQIRDAAFSLFNQSGYNRDTNLSANSVFSDSNDYSSPTKPAAGLVLPAHGLQIEVINQSADSSTATVRLVGGQIALNAGFDSAINARSVVFTNSTVGGTLNYTHLWEFGDGTTSSASSPTHDYAADGSFNVTLTVTDTDLNSSVSTSTIVLDTSPVASFTFVQTSESVVFTNTSAGGFGSLIYSWDFGNGMTSTDNSPTHVYDNDGGFTPSLTITDGDGRESIFTGATITVDTAPISEFSFSITNLSATFTNNSTGGRNGLTYAWDFGDSSSSTEASPSHAYTSAGNYTVVLVVTDGNGRTNQISKSVTAQAVPEPPSEPASSSGGGALSWFGLFLIGLIIRRKLTQV